MHSMTNLIRLSFALLLFFNHGLALANQDEKSKDSAHLVNLALDPIPGFYPVKPEVFFSPNSKLGALYSEIPGNKGLNTNNPVIANMVRAANQQGVLFWLGHDSNFARFFPLYRSAIGQNPTEPSTTFGEIGMGLGHFPTHDLSHLLFAMVSPRFEGLYDIEGNIRDQRKYAEARRKLVKLLVDTEALASAWTGLEYVMKYMVWANDQLNQKGDAAAIDPDKLESEMKDMKSLFQIGRMDRKNFIRISEAQTAGIFVNQGNPIKSFFEAIRNLTDIVVKVPMHADPKAYQRRIEMGMPQLLDLNALIDQMWSQATKNNPKIKLHDKAKKAAVALAIKTVSGVIFAAEAMFRPYSGAKAFTSSSIEFADGLLKPWIVEYSNRFRWGMTIEEANKNFSLRKQELINNRFAESVPALAQNVSEAMILRNEIVELGRRLVEVKWLNKFILKSEFKGQNQLISKRLWELELSIQKLVALHDHVYDLAQRNQPLNNENLDVWKVELRSQVKTIQAQFPLDEVIPLSYRNPFANYNNFWKEMFATVASPKAGMDSNPKMRAFFHDELIFERVKAIVSHQKIHGPKSFPAPLDEYMQHADETAKLYILEVNEALSRGLINDFEKERALAQYDHRFSMSRLSGDAVASFAAQALGDSNYLEFTKKNQGHNLSKLKSVEMSLKEVNVNKRVSFFGKDRTDSLIAIKSTAPACLNLFY